MSDPTILRLRLAKGIEQVLELDDASVCKAIGIEVRPATKSEIEVSGTREAFEKLLDECSTRGFGGGWDQPVAWYWSAQAAAKRIKSFLGK